MEFMSGDRVVDATHKGGFVNRAWENGEVEVNWDDGTTETRGDMALDHERPLPQVIDVGKTTFWIITGDAPDDCGQVAHTLTDEGTMRRVVARMLAVGVTNITVIMGHEVYGDWNS